MSTQVRPFDGASFVEEVVRAAGGQRASNVDQTRYLQTYLEHADIAARTMVVESPYVDRHYSQEFAGFYSTTLRTPPPHTTRLHFFRREFTESDWAEWVGAESSGIRRSSEELTACYLGYVVIRPVTHCPIGRTALATFPWVEGRSYGPASTEQTVHLAGLTLRVEALPFQQQDRGLGACATTALWSAVARASRADGGRTPTPLEVALAAPRAAARMARASDGLDLGEMTSTLRKLGYEAHAFGPQRRDLFLASIKACVRSGIPVILLVRIVDGDLHAVTVAGVREASDDIGAYHVGRGASTAAVRALTRLYLHDDRLGPYARAMVLDHQLGATSHLALRFDPQHDGFVDFEVPAIVQTAIVPLYPKIRVTPDDLIGWTAELVPLVAGTLKRGVLDLRVEPFFALGGSYLARIDDVLLSRARRARIRRDAHLSRYVAVARFFSRGVWVADFVFDTTDVNRGSMGAPLLLATGPDEMLEALTDIVGESVLVS